MLIYKITNKLNGKCYIGQTTRTVNERVREHLKESKKDSEYTIHRAIRKYGIDNFNIEILEDNVIDIDSLNKLEIFYIAKFGSFGERGYNMTEGGYSGVHLKGELSPWYGRKHTEETRKKISEAHKGKKFTEEHLKNMSKVRKGMINHFKDIPRTEEVKKKISETKKRNNKSFSGENNHNYGKHPSEETKKKMSEAKKGRYSGKNNPNYGKHRVLTEENKQKIRDGMARWKLTKESQNV